MTTSGATAFNPAVVEYIEEAYERAGGELRSGYDLATARRSLNILTADWASRGINLWLLDQESQALTQGTAAYNLPSDNIDLLDATIRTTVSGTQTDYVITRIGVGQYNSIPNKLTQARPLQFFVQKTLTQTVTLWPVPDGALTYTLVYWRLRRIQDAGGGGSYTMDIPFRFIPALVSGLAYYLALKSQSQQFQGIWGTQKLNMLQQQYMSDLQNASEEDRDRASLFLTPNPESYRIN